MTVEVITFDNVHLYEGNPIADQAIIRKNMVVDVLQWPGRAVHNGMEWDEMDTFEAVYLCVRRNGKIIAVNRMLNTATGKYMLKDIWPDMVSELTYFPRDPQVWEQSRFCFDPFLRGKERFFAIQSLRIGTQAFCEQMGIREVLWMAWPKSIKDLGIKYEALCSEVNIDGQPCFAGRSFTDSQTAENMRLQYNEQVEEEFQFQGELLDWRQPAALQEAAPQGVAAA